MRNHSESEKFHEVWKKVSWRINVLEILVALGSAGIFFALNKFEDMGGFIVFLVGTVLVSGCELIRHSIKNEVCDAFRELERKD